MGVPDSVEPDTRANWLTDRRSGIGGSDIAAIVGLSPWQSRYSVWADKVGLLPLDEGSSEAMEFGQRAEPMLAGYFTDRTGLYVAGEQMTCTVPDAPWMRCTLDGFAVESPVSDLEQAVAAVEFKTTSATADEWAQEVPVHYACQATWTSVVTQLPTVMFGVLHLAFGRPTFRVYTFTPTEDDKTLLVNAASSFWRDHVLTGTPPAADGSDATTEALQAAFRGDPGLDALEADSALRIECIRVNSLKARIKDAEGSLSEAQNNIRLALGDHTSLINGRDAKGKPIVLATWKPGERRVFDDASALREHPELVEYITKTPTRTLLVKPNKGN